MGLTQAQFAERMHVTPLTVHRWEAGHSTPRRLALERLRNIEETAATNARTAHSSDQVRAKPTTAPHLDFAGNPDAVLALAGALRLDFGHQFNPAFASEISRIDPLPHQRIAVYEHMLRQDPLRFLLADDAGAGKTIMTGLAIRDMLLRRRIRRVLIAPPAGLVGNWERELRTLFRLPFRIVTGKSARSGQPFRDGPGNLVIVSMDTLASDKVFEALRDPENPPYDLVVFDEAHKLAASLEKRQTRKTRRYKLAEAFAGCASPRSPFSGLGWSARHLLLLTATPHMGKDAPYHFLWRLLDPQIFATGEAYRRFPTEARSRHFIRRTKEEMLDLQGRPLFRRRVCDTFSYALTSGPDGEQALYDATTRYLREMYGRATGGDGAAQLVLGVFQRRLASSTYALLCSFETRMAKLEQAAEAVRSGRVAARDLLQERGRTRSRQSDYFDEHSTDEDVAEDGQREANEEFDANALGAVVTGTIEELHDEIATLTDLKSGAQALLESGSESKFEKLREVLEDPRHANEKWLVFTEHRDTQKYIVRRLEELGHADRVAQIHGGMEWRERERQTERFRDPAGARFLVATDAAGEGINLQFCAFMVNYDIPWNPARLEQRMGRIHRYGQKRDVRIVNLVADNTREGRVLQVLLDKLEAIRRELDSDKVFDVIGRLFQDASLRDYMIKALTTEEGEEDAVASVDAALSGDRVRGVAADEEHTYGPPQSQGDIAVRLDSLQDDMERETYLALLPGYVRQFVQKSAGLLDLEIRGDLDGYFRLAPRRPGAMDPLLPALESEDYTAAARQRLCVSRDLADQEPESIWLHPGEPVFDALRERVVAEFSTDALRGAIFTDPRAKSPYLFHLAAASVKMEPEVPAAAPGAATTGGGGGSAVHKVLERHLLAVRHDEGGQAAESEVEPLLMLQSAPHVAPGAVPLAAHSIDMRAEAAALLGQIGETRLVADRRNALQAELPEREQRIQTSFDLRAAQLAARRRQLGKGRDRNAATSEGSDLEARFERTKRHQRALPEEKKRALAALAAEPGQIVLDTMRFVAHALVIPTTSPVDADQYDERVEEKAVRIAAAWERERGAEVRDVSKPERARAEGLANWPGFDLLSTRANGEKRSIEVKGRARRGPVHLEENEWKQACNLGRGYWLYVVFDCATSTPELLRVRDPFVKLLAQRRDSSAFTISARALVQAAEPS